MKYDFVPIEVAVQRLKNLIPVAGCFILGLIYYVHTIAYQRVLNKHQNLTNLYYDPTVRVASGQSAKNIVARISGKAQVDSLQEKIQDVLKEFATPEQQQSNVQSTVSAQSLASLPSEVSANNQDFAYSMCESIDYQMESFPESKTGAQDEETNNQYAEELKVTREEILKALGVEKKAGSPQEVHITKEKLVEKVNAYRASLNQME